MSSDDEIDRDDTRKCFQYMQKEKVERRRQWSIKVYRRRSRRTAAHDDKYEDSINDGKMTIIRTLIMSTMTTIRRRMMTIATTMTTTIKQNTMTTTIKMTE